MKRLIVILFIFVPLLSTAQEKADLSKLDGNSWRTWDDSRRLNFIAGFIVGSSKAFEGGGMLEGIFMRDEEGYKELKSRQVLNDYWGFQKVIPKKQFSREEVSLILEWQNRSFNSTIQKYTIYGITNEQIVDGLNKFYEGFRNRGIKLTEAIYIVKKQIKGASPEEVDAICEYLRSDYDDKKLQYKSKDGTITYAEFP